jgi:hypothetical protein
VYAVAALSFFIPPEFTIAVLHSEHTSTVLSLTGYSFLTIPSPDGIYDHAFLLRPQDDPPISGIPEASAIFAHPKQNASN